MKGAARSAVVGTIGEPTGDQGFTGVRRKLDADGWTSYRAFRRGRVVTFVQVEPGASEDRHIAWIAMLELEVSTFEPKPDQVPVLPIRTIRSRPQVARLIGSVS